MMNIFIIINLAKWMTQAVFKNQCNRPNMKLKYQLKKSISLLKIFLQIKLYSPRLLTLSVLPIIYRRHIFSLTLILNKN